ncbi:MAG: NAD(P)H-dependent oxidoreductase [Bacteroidota bacterium]
MELIKNLNWRYATKQFDPTKKVSESDLENIKEAIRLSASSYGLQAYKVLIVEDQALREKLKPAAWGQSQITDASHLLVFCSYQDVKGEDVEELFDLKAEAYGKDKSDFEGYINFIKGKTTEMSAEQKGLWNARQTYIALGNLLAACAELKIDACPMEGFDSQAFGELLNLEEQGLNATVLATIGYRSTEDQTQHLPKVRKSKARLFASI